MNDADRPNSQQFPLTKNATIPIQNGATPPRVTRGKSTRPRTFWTYFKRIVAVLFVLGCIGCGTVFGIFWSNSSLFRTIFSGLIRHPYVTVTNLRDPLAGFKPELTLPPEKQHIINVLLLGCDSDYDTRKPVAIKGTNGRSDAIMIARVDFDAKTVKVLSIPRDTAVMVPNKGLHKINAAHAIGGPELTQETIKSVFGLDTDYYVRLNFDGFQKVVDAVGGVDVNVHKPLNYDDNWGNLHVHLKPGMQHLNGYRAMGYVRIRHSDNDFMRAERQHEFLEALRDKVKQPSTFMKLPGAIEALTDNIKSNMTQDQMLTLGNFMRTLPRENIQLATLPCDEGKSFVYVKVPESEEVIRKLFYDGSPVSISINVPARGTATAMTKRSRRSRTKKPVVDVNTPKDDNGEPILIEPETTNPLPANGDTTPLPENGDSQKKPEGDSSKPNNSEKPGEGGEKKPDDKGKSGTGTGGTAQGGVNFSAIQG